jgi:hypothetical protein
VWHSHTLSFWTVKHARALPLIGNQLDSVKGFGSIPMLSSIGNITMLNITRNVMNAIKMNRLELLAIVRANKITHVAEFINSIEDYKTVVLQLATANMKLAKSADLEQFKKIKSLLPAPISYENSYTRAIRMLELSVEDIIDVEEDVFNQLVLDEWVWKNSFSASTSMYKSMSGSN